MIQNSDAFPRGLSQLTANLCMGTRLTYSTLARSLETHTASCIVVNLPEELG